MKFTPVVVTLLSLWVLAFVTFGAVTLLNRDYVQPRQQAHEQVVEAIDEYEQYERDAELAKRYGTTVEDVRATRVKPKPDDWGSSKCHDSSCPDYIAP